MYSSYFFSFVMSHAAFKLQAAAVSIFILVLTVLCYQQALFQVPVNSFAAVSGS